MTTKKTQLEMLKCLYDSVVDFKEHDYKPIKTSVKRLETAIFSRDDKNEFEMPGLMVTAQRANIFFNITCKLWKALIIGIIFAAAGGLASIVRLIKDLGIF